VEGGPATDGSPGPHLPGLPSAVTAPMDSAGPLGPVVF